MALNRFGSTTATVCRRLIQPLLLLGICVGLLGWGRPALVSAQQPEPSTATTDSAPQQAASSEDSPAQPPQPAADSQPQPPLTPEQPAATPPPPQPAAKQQPAAEMVGSPQPPAAIAPPQQTPAAPAADGTVSVVVNPAVATPPAAPASPPTATPAIQPMTAAPPAANRADVEPESTTAAETLLERVLQPLEPQAAGNAAADQSLDGLYARPLPLLEALQRSGDRSRRLWITQAYWKATVGFGRLQFASASLEQLQLIAPGRDPHDRGLLDVAIAAARADLAETRAGLIASQQQLVDLIRLPVAEPLPWPVDRPLVGPYETHFAAIFATRPATGRIRAINAMLPRTHEAVEARATAVLAAEKSTARAEADHARGTRPIEAVLAAHRMLREQQQGFLDALATYNLDIAEYAMAVADVTVPDGQYVSMLIASPVPWTPQPPATVVPASNLQPLEPQLVPTQ